MKFLAGAIPVFLLLSACASRDAAIAFPETPDPAGARRLEGDWILAMKTGDREIDAKLHFAYDGTFVSGSFTEVGSNARPISDVRVSRDRMAWKIDRGRDVQEFSGSLDRDGSLSGQMTIARNHGSTGDGEEPAPASGRSSGGHGSGGGHGRHGGAGGGGRRSTARAPAKWTAVPAAKAGADSK
jgi:uncharacterized membrane protein YgcG